MIDINTKVHDKFSIEFKVGFHVRRKLKENTFAINTWIFVPNSLDINSQTYSKQQFYSDVKSNVRLITPVFLLREMTERAALPLHNLHAVMEAMASDPSRTNIREYEYQIKMFSAIFKSALRDETAHILHNPIKQDTEYIVDEYLHSIDSVTRHYRELRRIINVSTVPHEVMNYYLFGDEFISNIIEQHLYRLVSKLQQRGEQHQLIESVVALLHREIAYKREQGYTTVELDDTIRNRELLFRQGILKKYVESDLFLRAHKKRDGFVVEQVYFSLAAGLSMIFATAIAFSFQRTYGNFTMPLFVALVVSYMLKDRIKELMRYYFAHRMGSNYFDNKTTISIKENPIGWSKEAMDFISENKVPADVMKIRSRTALVEAENRATDEKIILYRKMVKLDRDKMDANFKYQIAGINDIMRLHVTRFISKMDNPEVELYTFDKQGEVTRVVGKKIYYLNIIMQTIFEGEVDYRRFRVVFSRNGIEEIQEF